MRLSRNAALLLALIIAFTIFAIAGLRGVPFHPDESTQLFTSSDFETLWRDPLSLAWSETQPNDLRTHYHLVDAPLTRYLLGMGRSLAGLPALPVDWDWSKSWEANRAAGALPDPKLLFVGRLTLTLLLPFSLVLVYLIGRQMDRQPTGWLSVLLMGTNALLLLHNRRAMAEAALTFGVVFALWSFLYGDRRPWLAGLGLALAFNAKQSGLALLPVGLLAVIYPSLPLQIEKRPLWQRLGSAWVQYLGMFLLVTLALNPFLWRQPLKAAQAAWEERQTLQAHQVADNARLSPEVALLTPGSRAAALLANLYMAPLAFAETANYQEQTASAEEAYLASPGHHLLRGLAAGSILFALTLFGVLLALLHLRRVEAERRRALILLLLASLCLGVGLLYLVPLPWQRYVVPLAPQACLWVAYALGNLSSSLHNRQASHFATEGTHERCIT